MDRWSSMSYWIPTYIERIFELSIGCQHYTSALLAGYFVRLLVLLQTLCLLWFGSLHVRGIIFILRRSIIHAIFHHISSDFNYNVCIPHTVCSIEHIDILPGTFL